MRTQDLILAEQVFLPTEASSQPLTHCFDLRFSKPIVSFPQTGFPKNLSSPWGLLWLSLPPVLFGSRLSNATSSYSRFCCDVSPPPALVTHVRSLGSLCGACSLALRLCCSSGITGTDPASGFPGPVEAAPSTGDLSFQGWATFFLGCLLFF